MLLTIDHRSGQPIYRQVIEQFRKQIMAGQLKQGERLISVRDLAAQLRVNPMTVSKAYSLLEIEGLVERRRGVGLFVAELGQEESIPKKSAMLEDILRKAVVTAVQIGIDERQTHEMLRTLFEQYDSHEEE